MSVPLQHTIIRASAGTGKTHQLANRYLALLLLQLASGRGAPERLVAITFTRKGAGEFVERILNRLANAAGAGKKSDGAKLEQDLRRLVQGDPARGLAGLAPGASFASDTPTLQAALALVIDNLDRLPLGTIDSFMARSVQTLAFELGIDRFEIVETPAATRAREQLISAVLQEGSREGLAAFHDTLKAVMLKASSSFQAALEGVIGGSHEVLHSLPLEEAWGGVGLWGGEVGPVDPGWQAAALQLNTVVAVENFGHATINKSLAKALDWLARRVPGAPSPELPAWLGEEGQLRKLWFDWPAGDWRFTYQKKSRTVPARILAPLKAVLTGWLAAERAAYSRRTRALYDILSRYERLYNRLLRRRGRLMFADLPVLLSGQDGARLPEDVLQVLAFRWFVTLDHWLLDEFQDTSRTQWAVLKTWLDEALQDDSGEKSVFVVGDPKQSIYGWRGGEPRLFQDLSEAYPGRFSRQVMAESWRSRPAVLELVNRICDPERNPALVDPDLFPAAMIERWRYDAHVPEPERAKKPGYAALLRTLPGADAASNPAANGDHGDADDSPSPDDEDYIGKKLGARSQAIRSVLERARPLEKGLSCAILVRANAHGQAIARWLRSHGHPNVMVEGDARLAAESPVVAAIGDGLRWLNTPAHTLGLGHVRLTPLWRVLEEPLRQGTAALSTGEVWEHWRRRIGELGAGEVTRGWCAALVAQVEGDYNRHCLRQVDELAARYASSTTLSEWVGLLAEFTVRETAAPGSIHVLTIHKAKGLGYDLVFLPDLDLGRSRTDTLLLRRDDTGVAQGCLLCPPKGLRAWMPEIQEICDAQDAEDALEALCVLYVALTRAREATFMVIDHERPRSPSRARPWILGGIGGGPQPGTTGESVESPWPGAELVWEHGSRDFHVSAGVPALPAAFAEAPVLPPPVARRQRRTPSAEAHQALASTQAAQAWTGSAEAFGSAVHQVFEQIEWWTPGMILHGEDRAVEAVRNCLAVPSIRALFEKSAEADEAWREVPAELMEPNTVWSGVIDRLVLRRDRQGRVTTAIVADFKTDRADSGEELSARYATQMRVYRMAVATALRLDDALVRSVLVSTALRDLVPCN